ncbi:hypothetical protein DEJ45_04580 [Streptomyces venezuelae]|nr:hypothetical protein DEJ45_04580 [Streptomyces venezuelae]
MRGFLVARGRAAAVDVDAVRDGPPALAQVGQDPAGAFRALPYRAQGGLSGLDLGDPGPHPVEGEREPVLQGPEPWQVWRQQVGHQAPERFGFCSSAASCLWAGHRGFPPHA